MWLKLSVVLLFLGLANARPRRYHENEAKLMEVCANKLSNEYFRLAGSEKECHEVYLCTDNGLVPLRCPAGLMFDVEKQTCDWRTNVKNCNQTERTKLTLPEMVTTRSICETGKLACGTKDCIDRAQFCDGIVHCTDGSDEALCDIDHDPNAASFCNKETCKLPDCYCSENGTQVPNDMLPEQVPQMIMITFDDAVNNNNIEIYNELFNRGRKNPNGCTIKGTFFLSHKYTNYSAVQDLHKRGHEIAVHSITHTSKEKYWSNGTSERWAKEMAGARIISERFANITDYSVNGIRAPLLKIGGNNQFKMMEEQNFLYDSSMAAPLGKKPIWPYTLHHRMPHKCFGNLQNCPTRPAAVWEIPMNEYDRREYPEDEPEMSGCAMVDQCTNLVTGDLLYNFLDVNFDRHYQTNRAPLGLYFHASWLLNRRFLKSLTNWIDEKLTMPDVYFVTMTQVVRYMQNLTELSQINSFEPWKAKCDVQEPPACFHPNQCALTTRELPGETIRLHTCMECPKSYPWYDWPLGEAIVN